MISFDHPQYLFLILLVIPAITYVLFRLKLIFTKIEPLGSVSRDTITSKNSIDFPVHNKTYVLTQILSFRSVLYAAAWITLLCALAGPRWGTRLVPEKKDGSLVVFVMDISRSMTVQDIEPDRLSYAAEYASVLVDKIGAIQTGLVLVKGSGVLALPLNSDKQTLKSLLASLSPVMASSVGSGLGSGLLTAYSAFPENNLASPIVIFFTDGDETSGSLIEAAREAQERGVCLIIIGLGTDKGASLNVYPHLEEPTNYTSRLREDILTQAVKLAGPDALYVRASDTGSALEVIEKINEKNNKSGIVYKKIKAYRYTEFLLLAGVFFILGIVFGGRAWRMAK